MKTSLLVSFCIKSPATNQPTMLIPGAGLQPVQFSSNQSRLEANNLLARITTSPHL